MELSIKRTSDYMILLAAAAVAVALDQWSKNILRSAFAVGQVWYPAEWLAPFIQIVRSQNTGAAFSLGQGMGLFFIIAAVGAVIGILLYFPHFPAGDWLITAAMGLLMGGAVGNLIDRLLFGQVTDFISVSHFAVINLADVWINLGVAGFIFWLLRVEFFSKKRSGAPDSTD